MNIVVCTKLQSSGNIHICRCINIYGMSIYIHMCENVKKVDFLKVWELELLPALAANPIKYGNLFVRINLPQIN
jgi:hypothetical protein